MKGLSGAVYVVIDSQGRRRDKFPIDTADLPPVESVTNRLGPRVTAADETYLCSGVRLWRHRENAAYTVYILYLESRWRDALWEAIRPSLLLGGFVGLASVALAVGVGQRLSRRVQELERRTRLIAAGDFSPMPLPGRNDELRDLGRSVNEMAQQLARLQETVKKTERLRLLGQVGGGLAHQLRNAVTGARLAVQLHARECGVGAEALEVALRQLDLMEANLKRFLDLGRTGEQRREPCSLTALLSDVVTLLRPRCKHAHIDLRWQPPDADRIVLGDADQLGQLFLNVLSNAIEAAGPGGWASVALQIAESRGPSEKGPSAIIEVADSGPGPSAELAERLFEPFVTGKPEGVGLGLAVARQVAEAHGGRLDWRREPGRTSFRVELP
jgi:signal transduction histidine kinase